jgi:hypothetical protein
MPTISNVALAGGKIVLSGKGSTNDFYYVMTATNLVSPSANWSCLATNRFGPDGAFSFTNAVNLALPQTFYRLQLP